MKRVVARRYRRASSSSENSFFKKDSKQEPSFFRSSSHEVFFHPSAAIQRKCEKCEEDDKKVHRMTDQKEEEKKLQRQPDKKEEEKNLQRKKVASSADTVTSNYYSNISGGQNLSKDVNHFFSSRMGEDFSDVKIHTDSEAATSASDINARAYTADNHIVFNEGQYDPSSQAGKKLLAHELTHVVQNKRATSCIRRKVIYDKPTIVETDPVTTVLNNQHLALTTPVINGRKLPNDLNAAGNILFAMFGQPYIEHKDGKTMCKVYEPEIKCSAEILIIKKPQGKVWQESAPGSKFQNKAAACSNVPNVTVYIKEKGGGDAIKVYDKIMANEMEHVSDLRATAKKHFEPYISFLKEFSAQVTNDQAKVEKECASKFTNYVNNKDSEMIVAFLKELASLIKNRDKPGGSHIFSPNIIVDGKDCFIVNIKI